MVKTFTLRKELILIELKHISKVYEGANRVEALKDISLDVKEGEIFGIIGQSGAGKSTLIRCINMLEAPTSGSVIVNGTDLTTLGEAELRKARKNIGMIFQHFNLLSSRTVYDNVAFPLELQGMSKAEIKDRIEPILEIVGLSDRINNYPSQLSGGQKQRVGIARALASNPKVLLCDEATSALDPQTTDSILKLLKDINEKMGLTIVLITHEMHVIREICDRVAVIEGGVILEEGSTVEVFTHPRENTTKEFISSVVSDNLPPEALEHLELHDQWIAGTAPLVRLKFTGQSTDEPVVAGLVRRFNLDVSILFGGIDYIQNTSVGRLIVILNGDPEQIINLLITGTLDTLQMTIISTVMAMLLGIPLGVVLVVTSKGHILENVALNKVLGAIVNATRSVPFIILMVAIIPFTRMVVGTSIGTTAACVPLTIAAIPFLARLVETSIKDINFGVIEAAQSMGASPLQIIWKVLLPEALPTIIDNVTVLIVNLIGYSAMAGAIGGGGLGDIAIRYGYQRFQADIMIATIIILIILVQVVQMIGDAWSKAMNKK